MDVQDHFSRLTNSRLGLGFAVLIFLIGSLVVLSTVWRATHGFYVYFLRRGKTLKKLGSWAVVTGATDGIGRAYADALAKQGLHVVLVSRTASKLQHAAQDIEKTYSVQTKQVVADFSQADADTWTQLDSTLTGLDIGVLVNNVGLSYDHAEYYHLIEDQLIDNLIQVNIQATNKVTRIVLPGMKQRGRGAIVNIGSAAATVAPSGPLYAVYAGTKAYVDMFSKSLNLEYGTYGISVQNQAPAYVATKMSKIRRATVDAPTPAKWVASAIKHIGYESTSCPYWFHGLLWYFASTLPQVLVNRQITNMHIGLRKRYYKKLEGEGSKAKTA